MMYLEKLFLIKILADGFILLKSNKNQSKVTTTVEKANRLINMISDKLMTM